jgi:hypothetical protein
LKERILDSFSFVDGAHKVSIKANSIVKCDGEAKVRGAFLLEFSLLL